jgi:hypothetical protein
MRHEDEMRSGSQPEPDTDELSPAEQAAFAALPREADGGRLMEERAVRALRERGLLQPPRRLPFRGAWMAAGTAAAVALFACGIATGQWMAGRQAAEQMAEMRRADEARAATAVQKTGEAYVAALSALARSAGQGGTPASARTVATQGLTAAARQVLRVAPDDPVAAGILASYDRQQRTAADTAGKQRVVWF